MPRKFLASVVLAIPLLWPVGLRAQTAESKLAALEKVQLQERRSACSRPAKNEGEAVIYANMDVSAMKPLTDGFMKRYPGTKAASVHFSGAAIITRLDSEARAGKPVSDVVLSGQLGVLALIEKKIALRYRSPERESFRDGLKDKDGLWTAYMTNVMVSAYNTRQVKKEEAPRTVEDLLKPRWKGKLTMDSQSYVWFGTMMQYLGEEAGLRFMKRLNEQNISHQRGRRLMTQLVAAGEFDMAVETNLNSVLTLSKARRAAVVCADPALFFESEPGFHERQRAAPVYRRAVHRLSVIRGRPEDRRDDQSHAGSTQSQITREPDLGRPRRAHAGYFRYRKDTKRSATAIGRFSEERDTKDCSNRSKCSSRSIPHLFPPPRRGGGLRRGLERSAAVERLERFERKFFPPFERNLSCQTNLKSPWVSPIIRAARRSSTAKSASKATSLTSIPNFVSSGERHYKYLHGEWDVGEVSAASLLRAIEKGQQLLAIPVFFERGPRQRNIYHCDEPSETSVGAERQKVWLLPLRRHRRGLGARLSARRARYQNHRHAVVRLRPGSFHRP